MASTEPGAQAAPGRRRERIRQMGRSQVRASEKIFKEKGVGKGLLAPRL